MINLNNKGDKTHTHVYSDTRTTGPSNNNISKAKERSKGVTKGEETGPLLGNKNIKLTNILYNRVKDVASAMVESPLAVPSVLVEEVEAGNKEDGVVVAGVRLTVGVQMPGGQGCPRDVPLEFQGVQIWVVRPRMPIHRDYMFV